MTIAELTRKELIMKKMPAQQGPHFWKIAALILTGIMCFILVTGCSAQNESANNSNADSTQEGSGSEKEAQDGDAAVLPADAGIGIVYTDGGEFTDLFVAKTVGYLVSAGIPEENITRMACSEEELADNARKMIADKCTALMIGGADEKTAPGITDAAVKAKIPVVYFGTSPGEKELARWEKNGWKAAYVGSTYDAAAGKRADLIDSTGLEKLDLGKDDNVGLVVLYSGEDKPGDAVNRDTLGLVEELDLPVIVLTDDEEEEDTGEEQAAEETEKDQDTEAPVGEELSEEEIRQNAKEQVIEWMNDYGKELDVILCSDDIQALGAWDAVSEEKKKVGHDVMIMGFDSNTESLEEVAAGNIRNTFFNDFMEQSGNASNAVLAFMKGIEVQPVMTSEYVSVTVDNAQEILDISLKAQESNSDSDSEENTAE